MRFGPVPRHKFISRNLRHARFKSEIGGADSRNVFYILVVVVQSQNHVVPDLPLQTDVVVQCVGVLKPGSTLMGTCPRFR